MWFKFIGRWTFLKTKDITAKGLSVIPLLIWKYSTKHDKGIYKD